MWAAEAILKKDIHTILKKGQKVTITKGVKFEYAVWAGIAIVDVPKEFINKKTIKVISAE